MGWSTATDRDVLRRIAALLFALAELADRASLAPCPVRYQVLAILCHAEAVALTFVAGKARDLGMPPPQAGLGGNDPDDVVRLALSLRILALALLALAARAERSAGQDHITIVKIPVPRQLDQLAACGSQHNLPPDTS